MLEMADLQAVFNTWWLSMFTSYFRTKFYVFHCVGLDGYHQQTKANTNNSLIRYCGNLTVLLLHISHSHFRITFDNLPSLLFSLSS
jgi:hypothetical protein